MEKREKIWMKGSKRRQNSRRDVWRNDKRRVYERKITLRKRNEVTEWRRMEGWRKEKLRR